MDLFIVSTTGVIPLLQCTVIDAVKDPTSISFGNGGDIIVTSYEDHCLYVLGDEGETKHVIGSHGVDELHFKGPKQVSFLDGLIYVMEAINDRIQIVTPDGKFKSFFSPSIRKPFLSAFCIDSNGYVYMCTSVAQLRMVHVYHPSGDLKHQFDTKISRTLTGIAIDSDGNIHVSSYSGVKVFTPYGDEIREYCSLQWANGIKIIPSGLCLVICKGLLAVYLPTGDLLCEYRGQFYPYDVAIATDESVWIACQNSIVILPKLFIPPFSLSLLSQQTILQAVDELPISLLPPAFKRVYNEWTHELKIELHESETDVTSYCVKLKLGTPIPVVHRFVCFKLNIFLGSGDSTSSGGSLMSRSGDSAPHFNITLIKFRHFHRISSLSR
jgi:hypothetical protein